MSEDVTQITEEDIEDILDIAQDEGFIGFGGRCGLAAIAINRVLFGGKAKIVGVFNKTFEEHGNSIGHIAVLHDDIYWDADGQAKELSDIESFGMLDPEDPDYQEAAEALGFEYDEDVAYEVITREDLSEDDAFGRFVSGGDHDAAKEVLEEMEQVLRDAQSEHRMFKRMEVASGP